MGSCLKTNPFDADKDFVQPLQNMVDELSAKRGKIIVSGDELNSEQLEAITRSVAATGQDAGAYLIEKPEKKGVHKKLKSNPIIFVEENIDSKHEKHALLERVRSLYFTIRDRNHER